MKTATIRVNHIFGTRAGLCADIIYRGRLLKYFDGEDSKSLIEAARAWAQGQGFTHIKYIYG